MPPNNRIRFDNCHNIQHRRKQAIEPDKEQSVGHRQLRLRGNAPAQQVQLMPQQHNLSFKPCPSPKRRYQDAKKQDRERDH
jgi:hypothetical protein